MTNKIKEYVNILRLKIGKWNSLKQYPYLTVLEIIEKSSMYSQANVEFSSREMVFRITLLNENHREKILLKQLKEKDQAHTEASKITQEIGVKKVIYSPF